MRADPAALAFLGPQRLRPRVRETADALGLDGPVALITAGWQEREPEDEELRAHLGADARNLSLYHRSLEVFRDDPELSSALHERQARLRDLQRLYQVRLRHVLDGIRELRDRFPAGDPRDTAIGDAFDSVQRLDRTHLRRVRQVNQEFDATWKPRTRPAVRAHRRELKRELGDRTWIAVAGGHVVVLLNRLRLFDVAGLLETRPVIAWSGGAMVLSDRVVLFHDHPPQGRGYAEVLEEGLGLAPGVVPLPHARHRLDLSDPERVALLARRFLPARCLAMDEGAGILGRKESGWFRFDAIRELDEDGEVRESEP